MNTNSNNKASYRISLCCGIKESECPNLIYQDQNLYQDLEAVLLNSGWPQCLEEKLDRQIKPLDQFSISVSGCPNGCSRPQIADFGLIQAEHPAVIEDACTGCAECAQVCKEAAIDLQTGVASVDPGYCLYCGHCIRACPEGALYSVVKGYRVQVGGKLGRHPRLGDELPGIKSRDQVLQILEVCLEMHTRYYRSGIRFGQVMAEQGLERLYALLRDKQ